MRKNLAIVLSLCLSHLLFAQKPAKPVIVSISELNNNGVPLNYNFYAYIPSGIGDSMQFEFDTTTQFNSPLLVKYTGKNRSSSWIFSNPALFRLKKDYYMRVRAFANSHTASDWASSSFRSLIKLVPISPSFNDETLNLWRPDIQYGNPGCHGDFMISDTASFSRILFQSKLFKDTYVNNNSAVVVSAYNLPLNKRLYLRTRAYQAEDTTEWTVRTFFIVPKVGLTTPVQTYFYSGLVPDAAPPVTSADDSLFQYHFEIANNASFTGATKRTIWKIRSVNNFPHLPGSTDYVRYRVSYNGNFTPWSNTRIVTTYATIPDITVAKDIRGYKKLNFVIGQAATRVQIESDTTLNFNSPRRILFDSAAPYPTYYINYTWQRNYKDWVSYRNIHTRYRFGDGTNWTAWSKPVSRYLNPVLIINIINNWNLLQRFDFDTMIGATQYLLQCDTDSTFKTPNLLSKTYKSSEWTTYMAFPDIWRRFPRLYFRLMAKGKNGNSAWSYAVMANQNCQATIGGPDSTEFFEYPDKLYVYNVEGANLLKYQVSFFRDFRTIWATVINTKAPLYNPELMVPSVYSTKIYVRAKYYNNIDSTNWSRAWPVKTGFSFDFMQKPILISPQDKSTGVNSANARFTWNRVPGSKSYLIQFVDPLNSNIVYSDFTDSTAITVSGLPPGKKLQWKVLAIGNDVSRYFSESFELTTDFSAQSNPVSVNKLKIWPNPANEQLWISDYSVKSIELYNAGGIKVADLKAEGGVCDIRSLQPGLYFIRLNGVHGNSAGQKLLIQR